MEIILALPWIDLIAGLFGGAQAVPATTGALLYDVVQAFSGLYVIAKGAKYVAEKTPWEWDDGPAGYIVGLLAGVVAWLANLMTANTAEPPKRGNLS